MVLGRGVKHSNFSFVICECHFVFVNNFMQNVLTIKAIPKFYELASSLKVNFFKSKVTGIGVDEASIRDTFHL